MGIPVKLKNDGFTYCGEKFDKGDIFNAPHEALVSFMCDQEKTATRVDEDNLEPEKVGTMKRAMKGGSYNTKVMSPDSNAKTPIKTKTPPKKKAKQPVKATANAAENS